MKELEGFKEYMLERNLSHNTIDSYVSDIELFFEHTKLAVIDVSRDHIKDFVKYLRDNNISVSSSNRKLSALKTFFKYCLMEDIIERNPTELISGGKLEKRLPKILEVEDVDKFINSANSLRDRVIFEILFGAGIRREELIKIQVKDIHFSRGVMNIIGKGDKERIVPIYPAALDLIEQLVKSQSSEWLFPSAKVNGNHISKRRLNEIVKSYADRLGFSGITPHKFRHSFGTVLYDNGADIKAIQDLMGHSSINTTNIYAQVSVSRNKTEYLKYHPKALLAQV